MQDTIRDIRKQCRLVMNGIASTSMRERGLNYKLNFGLAIQQIKEIAASHTPNKELAEALWIEDTRELKILATLLYPTAEFSIEPANRWVSQISNQEIREQVCLNLFQKLPFAQSVAVEWSNNADINIRTTGYWLTVRLCLTKQITDDFLVNTYSFIQKDIFSNQLFLRNAALSVLKYIGRQSKEVAESILNAVSIYKDSPNRLEQEAYNTLFFEFDYFFGN